MSAIQGVLCARAERIHEPSHPSLWAGTRTQGNAAGMACAPVLPVKEGYSLAADWFISEPSVALNTTFTFLFPFKPISLVNKH